MTNSLTFRYYAQRFRQRPDAGREMVLFVAPAADIRQWAGVPRKAFDYQHGFQRTLNPTRIGEISNFFSQTTDNVSPTSIVLGFSSTAPGVSISSVAAPGLAAASLDLVSIEITIPNFEAMETSALIKLAVASLESRLLADDVRQVRDNLQAAAAQAFNLQDVEAVDDEFGISDDEDAPGQDTMELPSQSYLLNFYAELLAFQRDLAQPNEEDKLRQILYSILKPAIIVDGQHRVFGAASADETIQLSICAFTDGDWAEHVFQFVVINQKAKPIKPAFLNAIIATSLSSDEITAVYDRLEIANIDVEKAQTMNRINTDPDSPFRGMIDFEIEGSEGFLQFPGVNKLAKDFEGVPRSQPGLLTDGQWASPEEWRIHFYALWHGIKDYFAGRDPRLWREPTENNPNNLLKIVALQEVQRLMLDTWADTRSIRLSDPVRTREMATEFWTDFPTEFFTDDWKKKGLQTQVGRDILRNAMIETRRNIGRRSWGHRRLGLFRD